MRILFLDDQSEMLGVYQKVCNPALLKPGSRHGKIFQDESQPDEGDQFEPVLEVEFKGSFFLEAGKAVEGFRKLAGSPFRYQIAVLDMQLPESSGLEVAKDLLQIDSGINLIFVTAYSDWSVHTIAQTLGRDETKFMFLKKPFELQEMLQALLYMNANLLREQWQKESLRNLINFTKRYKVESLEIFDALLELKTVDLVQDLARMKVPDLIAKNEKVLEVVEMILTNDMSGVNETFLLKELLDEYEQQVRVKLNFSQEAFQNLHLTGNRSHITFALRCLVNNGLDFSKDAVTISASVIEGESVVITVLDSGLGIQRQYQNEVFEPEFKLDPISTKAGFGLPLAKKVLLTMHRADMAIKSTPGKGTAIKFTLPCKPAE